MTCATTFERTTSIGSSVGALLREGVADPGQRVIRMNGKLVRPGPLPAIRGSGAIVCGRENSREQPRGPRLDQQGVVSRMAAFACPIIT